MVKVAVESTGGRIPRFKLKQHHRNYQGESINGWSKQLEDSQLPEQNNGRSTTEQNAVAIYGVANQLEILAEQNSAELRKFLFFW